MYEHNSFTISSGKSSLLYCFDSSHYFLLCCHIYSRHGCFDIRLDSIEDSGSSEESIIQVVQGGNRPDMCNNRTGLLHQPWNRNYCYSLPSWSSCILLQNLLFRAVSLWKGRQGIPMTFFRGKSIGVSCLDPKILLFSNII